MAKTKLTLSIEEDTIKELKKAAIDAGITLSDLLAKAGTASITQMQPNRYTGGVPTQEEVRNAKTNFNETAGAAVYRSGDKDK